MHLIQNQKSIALAVTAAIGLSCSGASVFAQDQGQEEEQPKEKVAMEEIVITAERRETTESTTAISMEVLTGDALAERQVVGFEDLQKEVPNLQFNTNGFGWAQANIRGVGNASGGGPYEQVGVPIIIDGGAQGEEISLGGAMMDVGNVQVLRGPQGTFIGQSAAGGAIIVTSAKPNFDGVNGFMEGQVGSYDQEKITGAVNLPVSDTIAARISFLSSTQGSFYKNEVSGFTGSGDRYQPGSSEDRQYRLGVLWEPNDQFSAYLKFESTDLRYIGNPSTPSNRPYTGYSDHDNDPLTPAIPVTTYSRYADGPNGESLSPDQPFHISHPYPLNASQENKKYTIDLSYRLDSGITLNSVSNWTEFYGVNGIVPNNLAYGTLGTNFAFLYGPDNYTINQEFTVISPDDGRLDWLIGISGNERFTGFEWGYDNSQVQTCGWEYDSSWSPCQTLLPQGTSYAYYFTETTQNDYGAFFQLDYQLTDAIELNLGGRWNKNEFLNVESLSFPAAGDFIGNFYDETTGVPCPGPGATRGLYCAPNMKDWNDHPFLDSRREYSGEVPTYRVGVNWEPGDNQFLYAFYARGYKSGQPTQVDRTTGEPLPTATPIVEEIVDDYEFGWKGTLLDGALYAELGYFYQDYTDMQLAGSYTTSATSSGGGTGNIGGSTIKGFEGSLRTSVGGLNISGSFGYVDSELNGISTYETRAFDLDAIFGANSQVPVGDTSKGCVTAPGQNCFDFSPFLVEINGAQNLNSPELSYSLGVDYPIELNNGAVLTPQLSYRYTDANYTSIFQVPGENYFTRDEVKVLDFSIIYVVNEWTIQGFINNVTDEVYVSNAGDSILFGDPRVAGIRARMSF